MKINKWCKKVYKKIIIKGKTLDDNFALSFWTF